MATHDDIDLSVPPSGEGCADCDAASPPGWWVHLRRCARCGHIGCCDSSPGQHATTHAHHTGHPVIASFEPGEDWFFDYRTEEVFEGPALAEPTSYGPEGTVPGPPGRVPEDWREHVR